MARHANTISGAAVAFAFVAGAAWAFTQSTVTVTEFEPGSSLVLAESQIHQPAVRWLQLTGACLCLAAIAVRSWLPYPRFAASVATAFLAISAALGLGGFLVPSLLRPPALDDVVALNGGCAACHVATSAGLGVVVALGASLVAALATATLAVSGPDGGRPLPLRPPEGGR